MSPTGREALPDDPLMYVSLILMLTSQATAVVSGGSVVSEINISWLYSLLQILTSMSDNVFCEISKETPAPIVILHDVLKSIGTSEYCM